MPSKVVSEALSAHWRPLIEQWRRSGQAQKAFCREHDLNYDQFVYWRRKFVARNETPARRTASALVPVTCIAPATGHGLSLTLPNGMELRGLTLDNLPVVQQLLARL